MFRIVILTLILPFVFVNCKICPSMNIRNDPKNLKDLENCTEIAGYLHIVLFENREDYAEFSEKDYENAVFPKLRVISDYLLMYNVTKLNSIGQLFPNLTLIRGRRLFKHYSLVLYGNTHMKEIGLVNLLSIARGQVRIGRCPSLCYIDTVQWDRLGVKFPVMTYHVSDTNACGRCPSRCTGGCWNATDCQHTGDLCHKECLGCTENYSPNHCKVCRNYEDHGRCVKKCPPDKYTHTLVNQCVTKDECETLLRDVWWTHNGECVNECPNLHEIIKTPKPNSNNYTISCHYCGYKCIKHCNSTDLLNTQNVIDAKSELKRLKGCTHINGSLIIKMADAEMDDLKKYLGSVRNISGMLMIGRTRKLSSMEFLKNITYIGSDITPEMDMYSNYSIFMYENQNLQQLWNYTNFNLTLKGTIGFHDNPLLCKSEIDKLAKATGVEYSDVGVSPFSNGDKANCLVKKVDVHVKTYSKNATLTWHTSHEKNEIYVGFTLFYKIEVKGNTSTSTFTSEEVCTVNEWNSTFTTMNSTTLTGLQPNSSYAYYLILYVSSKTNSTALGFHSTIEHFETFPDDPDGFDSLKVTAINDTSVKLDWEKPTMPNGVLVHYDLYYDQLDDELLYERDYCANPRTNAGERIDHQGTQSVLGIYNKIDSKGYNGSVLGKNAEDCSCVAPINDKIETEFQYRDLKSDICHTFDCKNMEYNTTDQEKIEKRDSDKHKYILANETSFTITNLRPFTLYIFYFSACNFPIEQKHCSGVIQRFTRTKKKPNADDVEIMNVEIQGEDSLKVTWREPSSPNSGIVAYRISLSYANTVIDNSCESISRNKRHLSTHSKVFNGLRPGEYTISIRAESLAGESDKSNVQTVEIKSANKHVVLIVVSVICSIFLIFIFGVYIYLKKFRGSHLDPLIPTINPDYAGFWYEQDEWEIERRDVEVMRELGHGTFGTVFQGVIKSRSNMPCAIKTVNESLSLHDKMKFLNEASVMKSFSDCYHVVKLLGVVSVNHPPLVVMELMERGDLKSCLRRIRDSSQNLTSNEIYRMAVEIADGMAYLAAKKFIHRDLAARNCMVAADRTVKVGDFGMARDVYETDYYRKDTKGLLPVRWMAPESLADGVFTTDSDVWSFGVVLWEIATLAEQPYQGYSNGQVLQFVISKGRLTRPEECSDFLYELMRKCWSWRPNDRPSFWDLVDLLEDRVSEDFKLVAFVHSREASMYSRQRVENAPALAIEAAQELLCQYNAEEEEVRLRVGGVPRRPSYLQTSLNQRRFSQTDDDFY
ncbi:insulin receptor-like [Diabrotica undecimpunctata]|uniref:insulin receptor-like n=1 Tax=Diabrotica undecimpunctata TaxID=50387 RepID=UPI003B63FE29